MLNMTKVESAIYSSEIVKMYEGLNNSLVEEMINRIKDIDDFDTLTARQIKTLAERGGREIFNEAILKADALSIQRKSELSLFFTKIVNDDISGYKSLYDERGVEFQLTENQLELFNEILNMVDNEFKNFTNSIAFASQEEFIKAVDNMFLQISTGGTSFETALKKTTSDLASKGITLTMANGNSRSLEAAVRQNVMYGLKRLVQEINDELIDYLEADAVQVNISPNCRPTHQAINGKVFSLKRNNSQYPYLKAEYQALFNEYNCQHYKSPFIIGVSEPLYSDDEINKANNRTVNYNGEKIPYYEATQKQRALERAIRNAKKEYVSSKTTESKSKISKAQSNMRNFIKATGLTRDYSREYYAGYN